MTPEKRPQDQKWTGPAFNSRRWISTALIAAQKASSWARENRRCVYRCPREFEETAERPENHELYPAGLRVQTLGHGGHFPDKMPDAIRATDAQGRSWLYMPIEMEDGQVVDSRGFTLERAKPLRLVES
jgi:hypothetical protein